jgi:hypothetical protein
MLCTPSVAMGKRECCTHPKEVCAISCEKESAALNHHLSCTNVLHSKKEKAATL